MSNVSSSPMDLPAYHCCVRIWHHNEWGCLEYRYAPGDVCEIVDIWADGERRRTGIGSSMVERLMKACKRDGIRRVFAVTRFSNGIARDFYEALGFRIMTTVWHFYPESDDDESNAIMYGKDVT